MTADARRTVYPAGAVAIEGRRIAAVGPEAEVVGASEALRVLDAGGGCVHPGFLDAHFRPDSLAADAGAAEVAVLAAALHARDERLRVTFAADSDALRSSWRWPESGLGQRRKR